MTRRRLVLAAALAVVALAAAWSLAADGLTAEERLLVGTWRHHSDLANDDCTWALSADRRSEWSGPVGTKAAVPAAWAVRGGEIVLDYEPSPMRRALRPVLNLIGVKVGPVRTVVFEFATADEFVITGVADYREVWTRESED